MINTKKKNIFCRNALSISLMLLSTCGLSLLVPNVAQASAIVFEYTGTFEFQGGDPDLLGLDGAAFILKGVFDAEATPVYTNGVNLDRFAGNISLTISGSAGIDGTYTPLFNQIGELGGVDAFDLSYVLFEFGDVTLSGSWLVVPPGFTGASSPTNTLTPFVPADILFYDSWRAFSHPSGENSDYTIINPVAAGTLTDDADLAITKVSDPLAVAGESLYYTIVATNNGPNEATSVTITDTFAAELGTCNSISFALGGASGNDNPIAGDISDSGITMPLDSTITYTVTCDIPSDATAGTDVLSNTTSIASADVNDPTPGDNTATELTDVARESAISVTKTADPSPLVALGGTQTYTIEVSNGGPSDASNLFVTETLPAGLTVTAMNPPAICDGTSGTVTCALPGPVAAGDSYSFSLELAIPDNFALGMITNTARVECTDPACSTNTTPEESAVLSEAQTRVVSAVPAAGTALIAVQKFFTDGNDVTPVTLTLECTSGSYEPASVIVYPDEFAPGSAFEHIFVVTDIPVGTPNPCTVVEEPVAGYDATYICGQDGSTSTVDSTLCNGFADFTPGTTACGWLDVVAGDSNLCGIFNDPAPVEFAVSKVWDVSNAGGGDEVNTATDIVIYCDSEIVEGDFDDPNWIYQQGIFGDATVTVHVVPVFAGSACWALEPVVDSGVEVTNGCEAPLAIGVGQGASCVITNTVFFEGIPTLNQYGLAIMALLMLGVGMVGFRRFA